MGINGLNKFLRDVCPDVFEEIHISEYAYKKVAIDISLYLYVFKATYGDSWLKQFIKLIECLRKYELHCVFSYDSGATHDKDNERKERAEGREKHEKRVIELEEAIFKYHDKNIIDPILLKFQRDRKLVAEEPVSLLRPVAKTVLNIGIIEYYVAKMRRQIFTVTPEDFNLTKKLFDILNVPYFQAPMEAETACSDLCKRKLVDAVLSRDTDVMAYASPVFLTGLNIDTGVCTRVTYSDLLEKVNLTSDQFLDLCIMCGTDYNKNIFRVGPKKSYVLIKEHGSLENIESNTTLDTSILKYKRGRELFREYEQLQLNIPYCASPDFSKLKVFLVENGIDINVDELERSFVHNIVIFEDGENE
jgi:5'-3' exonuclease